MKRIIVICLLLSLRGILMAQSNFDINNLIEEGIVRPDSIAVAVHLKSMWFERVTPAGIKRMVIRKEFDRQGRLGRRTEYDTTLNDSVVTIIDRKKRNTILVSFVMSRRVVRDATVFQPGSVFQSFLDSSDARMATLTVQSVYTFHPDSSVNIVTWVDGKLKDSATSPPLFYSGDSVANASRRSYDSVWSGDTLTLSLNWITRDGKQWQKESWQYDKQHRLIQHMEYSGPPLTTWRIERTVYDTLAAGSRVEYVDLNPADGKPDYIYTYNAKGQMMEATKITSAWYGDELRRNRSTSKSRYDSRGLLSEKDHYLNEELAARDVYHYSFF